MRMDEGHWVRGLRVTQEAMFRLGVGGVSALLVARAGAGTGWAGGALHGG